MNRHDWVSSLDLSGVGIEIGVQSGDYAAIILQNSDLHLILLDSWRHLEEYPDMANVSTEMHIVLMNNTLKTLLPEYEGRFTLIRELSEQACPFFKDGFFDFAYLDANHSEEFVFNELIRWWPKIKSGGIIGGHDYVNLKDEYNDFGVKDAVDRFFFLKQVPVNVIDFPFPTWWVTK